MSRTVTTHRQIQGMTLLELSLTIVLVGIVGLSFVTVYGTAQRYLIQTMQMATSQAETSFAVAHMRDKMFVANQVLLYNTDVTRVAFRWDPNTPLANKTVAVDNDRWSAYRLINGNTLEYVGTITGVAGTSQPTLAQIDSGANAGRETIARNVTALQFLKSDGTPVSGLGTPVTQVLIDISVQQPGGLGGQNPSASHIVTVVAPRGVGSA